MKLFPWLLESKESQAKDGLRLYPKLLTWFGTKINMVESYKDESMHTSASVPLALLVMGILLHLSF